MAFREYKKNIFLVSFLLFCFTISSIDIFAKTKKKSKKSKKFAKIGYVDIDNIIENTPLKGGIQKRYLEYKNKIQALKIKTEKKILETRQEINKQASLLGYKEYQIEIAKLYKIIIKYETELIQLKSNINDWEKASKEKVIDDLILAIEIIARSEKVDMIISKEPIVIYGKSYLDYTERVKEFLSEINQRDNATAR